jgi:hypothetical protein
MHIQAIIVLRKDWPNQIKQTNIKLAKSLWSNFHLFGSLLSDDKLVEPTANLLGRGELASQVGAAPPAAVVLPVALFPATTRNPNDLDLPDDPRARARGRGVPWLSPDLRRLPAVRAASERGRDGAGEVLLLLLLAPAEERPGAAALPMLLLRGAARVDATRGRERRGRGAGAHGG